jgi:hypothetical protein
MKLHWNIDESSAEITVFGRGAKWNRRENKDIYAIGHYCLVGSSDADCLRKPCVEVHGQVRPLLFRASGWNDRQGTFLGESLDLLVCKVAESHGSLPNQAAPADRRTTLPRHFIGISRSWFS